VALETIAIVLACAWLALLTLVVLLLTRQLGLLTLRLDQFAPESTAPVDTPTIGTDLLGVLRQVAPELVGGLRYVVFMSATCAPCRELAPELHAVHAGAEFAVVISGPESTAAGLVAALPHRWTVISDPGASQIVGEIGLRHTPTALELDDGVVTGRAVLNQAQDLQRLIDARARSNAAEIGLTVRNGRGRDVSVFS
jgi:thiol-disulfide isomerase/thioredoxin